MKTFCIFLATVLVIILISAFNFLIATTPDNASSPSGPYFPGKEYDLSIPRPSEFFGFALGSKPVNHFQMVSYLKLLAESSDKVQLYKYGETYEKHGLYYLAITLPENMAEIDRIKEVHEEIADPRKLKPGASINTIIKQLPAVVWAGYSIHGDELSSTDAAIAVAYQLVAGTDEVTYEILNHLVVLIDPVQNPDGRERFLTQVRQFSGKVPNSDIQSIQHTGFWPWGRGNHYLIDLNRDMFTLVHPETRGKMAVCLEWHPQVMIDAHEMGSLDTYLFSPPRAPFNPHWSKEIRKWWRMFAEGQAKAFDSYGWSYYTRDWNEEWFPGYTSAWGIYLGMVGILYEQAGVSGTLVKRKDGTTLTYSESVHHHLVSTLANLKTAANNKEELLKDYYNERLRALTNKENFIGEAFIVDPSQNPDKVNRFIQTLILQGIEVKKAESEFIAKGLKDCRDAEILQKKFSPGTYIIDFAQPSRFLAQVLFDYDIHMSNSFLYDERRSLEKGWGSKMYDVSAWSMPLAYGLESYITKNKVKVNSSLVTEVPKRPWRLVNEEPAYGYMVDYIDDAATYLLAEALANELKPRVSTKPVTVDDRYFSRGSILFVKKENPEDIKERLSGLAAKYGLDLIGINTALAAEGPDLGGHDFRLLTEPKIALLTGQPLNFSHYGCIWHMLDYEYGLKVASLDISRLGRVDLSNYNVLIMPSVWGDISRYKAAIGEDGLSNVKNWVKDGGTLVAISTASTFCADTSIGLSKVRLRRQALDKLDEYKYALEKEIAADNIVIDSLQIWLGEKSREKTEKADKSKPSKADLKELKRQDDFARKFMPRGVIFDCRVDTTKWLSFGLGESLPVFLYTEAAFLSKPPVRTVARLKDEKNMRLSGLAWPETRRRWANTAYCTQEQFGKGQVILFAGPPNMRSYFYGSKRLLVNAILLGPGLGARLPVPYEFTP